MEKWKRFTGMLLILVLSVGLLAGCGSEPQEEAAPLSLAVSVGTAPVSLDPIYAQESRDQTILVHLYENLMRQTVDAEGNVSLTYGMAKSVEQEENYDGTVTYTFRLRNAKWSDGKSVDAEDFVYAWQRLTNPVTQSPYASLLSMVSGYDEARATGDMNLLQVSAKNDSTLVVALDGNYDWFLSQVCTATATMPLRKDVVQKLKEANAAPAAEAPALPWWYDPTALVTNGPYQVLSHEEGSAMSLVAGEEYYETLTGPKELTFHFAKGQSNAQVLYEEGVVDMIWPLSEKRLAELAQDETWSFTPELSTYAVLYNCGGEPFGDAAIRQALNLVIDRNAVAALAGVTARAAEGLVPFGVPENEEGDFRSVGGACVDNDPETYNARCIEAVQILADAGYDSVIAHGELNYLYINSERNRLIAEELCGQWKAKLGLEVTPVGMTRQELWQALHSGQYALAGVEVDAVSNDAECFLSKWISDSADNVLFYENSAYDTLMSIIASAPDGTARMGCLHDAEELLLTDNALTPLYHSGTDWEVRDTLSGIFRDPRGWFSFVNAAENPVQEE